VSGTAHILQKITKNVLVGLVTFWLGHTKIQLNTRISENMTFGKQRNVG
jgi:hypothetical protein